MGCVAPDLDFNWWWTDKKLPSSETICLFCIIWGCMKTYIFCLILIYNLGDEHPFLSRVISTRTPAMSPKIGVPPKWMQKKHDYASIFLSNCILPSMISIFWDTIGEYTDDYHHELIPLWSWTYPIRSKLIMPWPFISIIPWSSHDHLIIIS